MKNLIKKIFKGNTLYYPGCLTKHVAKDLLENYRRLLREAKIDFIELKDKEYCCGSPVKNAGSLTAFKELARKNLKVFKEHNVDLIVTNCPGCALVLKEDYKKLLGKDWDIEVTTALELLKKSSKKKEIKTQEIDVTYHDSCHLGRGLGIFKLPREIIKNQGYKLREMELSKEKSYCCGAGGGVRSTNKELSNRIGKSRINQAEQTGAQVLFTACPMCYMHLKANAENLEVKELGEIL